MKYFTLVFLLFLPVFVFSQTCRIEGKCVDRSGKGVGGIIVRSPQQPDANVYSDSNGRYVFPFNCIDKIELYYNLAGSDQKEIVEYVLEENQTVVQAKEIRFNFQQQSTVVVSSTKVDPFVLDKLKLQDLQKLPMGGVERFLLFTFT